MKSTETPYVLGQARFTFYTPGVVRMEYADQARFAEGPSLLMGPTMPASIKVEHAIENNTLVLKTARMTLTYTNDGQGFHAGNLRIEHRHFNGHNTSWTPGQADRENLGSVPRCLDQWKWCGGPAHHPVEGVLSREGGHFIQDHARVYGHPEYDWPINLDRQVWFDGYFFAYGADFKAALKDYITVFGRIPMVPRWAFGFWYSRWYAYTEKDLIDLANRYRREKIPMDVMVIDTDWRGGWGGYDWSATCFPDPRRALARLRKLGLRTSLNDHPGYDNYDPLNPGDSHIPAIARRLGPLPHQGQWACDWSNKRAVEAWKDIILAEPFGLGMDFWWIDGWIKPPFGSTDSQLWANRQYFELTRERTGKRGMILARWGGVGSHRYPVQFSGDTPSEWEMLRHQIEMTSRSAGLCATYWSHDIGGFFNKRVDEELFIRWFQFGAMSPIFRTHSDHGDREPWKYSPRVRKLFRKQTRIRYALAPYWYTLAREAHDEGLPILRPLFIEYNDNDGGALYRKHQYMIGRDLLVIPADGPADPQTGAQRKRAYFPNGEWLNLETAETRKGMLDGSIDIPVEYIPTYVRRGAIIPSQPVGEALGTLPSEALHLDVYPDPVKASSFTLYEDDGETEAYAKDRCARTRVDMEPNGADVRVCVSAPAGRYRGMPQRRLLTIQCAMEEASLARAVHVRVGRQAWETRKPRYTRRCLAGEIRGERRFCAIQVETPNKPVEVRFEGCFG